MAKDCFVCKPSPDKDGQLSSVCFPPLPTKERIILFEELTLPDGEIVRPPVHKLRPEQLAAYRRGVQQMRDLPADRPHSLAYQASIHHTFCYGHYKRGDADGKGINVHNSWLFAPWHQMYIYFFERTVRSYADDDDFALPYWNWDEPARMKLPDVFKEDALLDENRNPNDVNNYFVDLNYGGKKPDPTSCVPFTSKLKYGSWK